MFYKEELKAIGGIFALAFVGIGIWSSCSGAPKWVEECEKGGRYNEHYFTFTHSDIFGDGIECCLYCGIERRVITDKTYPKHYGALYKYRNPKTKAFDTYVLSWTDAKGRHYKVVREYELK